MTHFLTRGGKFYAMVGFGYMYCIEFFIWIVYLLIETLFKISQQKLLPDDSGGHLLQREKVHFPTMLTDEKIPLG